MSDVVDPFESKDPEPLSEEEIAELAQVFAPTDDSQGATLPEPPEIPVAETEEDPEPPAFIIREGYYGPGVPSILLADGTPVGRWLSDEHYFLSGSEVYALLVEKGMPEEHARWFEKHRGRRIAADSELAQMPAVQNFAQAEREFEERKENYRAAFLKAYRKKESK